MKNFDIAKYLREHQLGSYGILNHYVDLKPLKEEEFDHAKSVEDEYADCIRNANGDRSKILNCESAYENQTHQPAPKIDASQFYENAYEGPEHELTGNGEGDEFEQAETVSEEETSMDYNRIMDIGGNSIEQAIIRLMDSGFPAEDVLELCQMLVNDQYAAKAQGTPY